MADLVQTVANVNSYSGASTSLVQAGEAITPGVPCYKKASDSKYYQTDANLGAEESGAAGIALSYAPAADDYFVLQTAGDIDLGGTLTVGETYYVSATKGKIAPAADVAAGWFPVVLGIASTAAKMTMGIQKGTVAHA